MKTIDILSIIANDEENNYKFIKEVYDLESIRKIFGVENLKEFLNKEVAEIEIEEDRKIEKLDENNTNVLTNIIENRKKINEIIDYINEEEK